MKRWALLFVVLEALACVLLIRRFQEERTRLLQAHAQTLDRAWHATEQGLITLQDVMGDTLLDKRWIVDLVARAGSLPRDNRARLRQVLAQELTSWRRDLATQSVDRARVYLSEGVPFLDLAQPTQAPAPTTLPLEARRTLVDGTARSAFVIDDISGIRYYKPIVDGQRIVGLLETGVSPQALVQTLHALDPMAAHGILRLDQPESPNAVRTTAQGGDSTEPTVLYPMGEPLALLTAQESGTLSLLARVDGLAASLRAWTPFARALSWRDQDYTMAVLPLGSDQGPASYYLLSLSPEPALADGLAALLVNITVTTVLLLASVLLFAQLMGNRAILIRERQDIRAITDTMGEGLYVLDEDGRITFANQSAATILGYDLDELMGARAHFLFHAHDADSHPVPMDACPIYLATLDGRVYESDEETFFRKDGTIFPVEVRCAPLGPDGPLNMPAPSRAPTQRPARVMDGLAQMLHEPAREGARRRASVVTFVDITERKANQESLRKLSRAVEQSPASVIITNAEGTIEYVNPQFEKTSGYKAWEVVGANPRILKSGHTTPETYAEMWRTLAQGREWRGEFHNRRKDGSLYWEYGSLSPIKDNRGRATHYLAVKEDITARKEAEARLIRQANYDELTDLPNRSLCYSRLKEAIGRARNRVGEDDTLIGVLFIDLDHFKHVNDSLGHAVGDKLLAAVARRLRSCLRKSDTLSRQGGDEFLMVLPSLPTAEGAGLVAESTMTALRKPFSIDGREIFVASSIGITLYPRDGQDAAELLRNADSAMYTAKAAGRNTYRFFSPEMEAKAERRLVVEGNLRYALAKGELRVAFQPLVDGATGETIGAEALLRWDNPQLGAVSPVDFIPIAEETGLIVPIGAWVLDQAIATAAGWRRRWGRDLVIAVNASVRQFQGNDLATLVDNTLRTHGLPPHCLELELTESLLLDVTPTITGTLDSLSRLGVQLSLDDFGTGYSALSYLKTFPFDILKIDRSFIRDCVGDPNDEALARAIIAMARGLNLKVIAEGVETPAQMAFAKAEGCDIMQGYLFGRPMSADAFQDRLDQAIRETTKLEKKSK
ncbi:MAG: EAL domain-containing protein [Rhodospirillum sp.]|nr:EAL domain-containing protein [Rhodospirillum sp.]MCF8491745.1 EAL domain-containing protein [Rhodospirillum sp.]MCF8502985.1 EAL domain-containing protein [Rhodospirillum sp.]